MSGFKGTPGPWSIETYPDHPGWFDIRAKIGNRDWLSTFASVHTNSAVEQVPAETEPNARLIAAAPELFRAVDEFRRLLDMPIMKEFCPVWGGYSELVDEAMAKALGDE